MIVNVIKANYIQDFIIDMSIKVIDQNSVKSIDKKIDLMEYIQHKKDNGIMVQILLQKDF